MTFNFASSNRLQDFDPVVEATYLLSGQDTAELSYEEKIINFLAETVKQDPGSEWAVDALTSRFDLSFLSAEALFRMRAVDDANSCFERGVPINVNLLAIEQQKLIAIQHELNKELPLGLVDGKGDVDKAVLANQLSLTEHNDWPKKSNGDLDVNTKALETSKIFLAKSILKAKKLYRDKKLLKCTVDGDGRHRSYPQPFGTRTGRDRPTGAAFIYLPKHFRSLVQPNSGTVIAIIDYQCQEPTIAAALSGSRELYNLCYQADLYQTLLDRGKFNGLNRKQVKRLLIAYLYGISVSGIAVKFQVEYELASEWFMEMDEMLKSIETWLNETASQAFKQCEIRSLDWRMAVKPSSSRLSIRNWPIQAAGADILRRACALLEDNNIPVIYRLHDAVMIEIPISGYEKTIKRAEQLMQTASAMVLNGYQLSTKVEQIFWPLDIGRNENKLKEKT